GIDRGRYANVDLPARQAEDITYASACCSELVAPHDLACDRAACRLKRCASASQRKRTRGRKIGVRAAIADAIVGTGVSRGTADRDTQCGSILKCPIHGAHRLLGPG